MRLTTAARLILAETNNPSQPIDEAYQTKSIGAKKVWKYLVNSGLDADELEDLLFTMGSYYTAAGNDSEDTDFIKLGTNINKTAKDWKNRRRGN